MITARELSTREAIMSDLEALWSRWDSLLGSFTPEDWQRKHGKDWVFADVPYHMYYFDRDIVARPIERGRNVPPQDQRCLETMDELNEWNAMRFAERPTEQTAEESVALWNSVRDQIRRVVAGMNEADMDNPVFIPIVGAGWLTVRDALQFGRLHAWSELVQLRLRASAKGFDPPETATHSSLDSYMHMLGSFLNPTEAAKTDFKTVMEITGPGGGAWTMNVRNGHCAVEEGWADGADVVMTQSPESFVKTLANMRNPMIGMLTREIRVKGLRKMGTFGKLFSMPGPDRRIPWSTTPPAERKQPAA